MQQKVKQLQKECQKWQEKYNNLLEKNQNDLIKIRLREKQLNETIGKLQQEKGQMKVQYDRKIQLLNKQIQSLKGGQKDIGAGGNKKKTNFQAQNNSFSKPQSDRKQVNDKLGQLEVEKRNVQLAKLQKQVSSLSNQNSELRQRIQRMEVQYNQKLKQANQSHSKRQSQQQVQSQMLFSQVQRLRQVLQLTDVQYKNLAHKQEAKEELVRAKNEELNVMTEQLKGLQQKVDTLQVQGDGLRKKCTQQQRKREQLEQENTLLKQMIKGQKTMIKIKENQIARLKQK